MDLPASSFAMAISINSGEEDAPLFCTGTPSLPTKYFSKFHGTDPVSTLSRYLKTLEFCGQHSVDSGPQSAAVPVQAALTFDFANIGDLKPQVDIAYF